MKLSLKQIHSKIKRLKFVMLVQRGRFKGLPLRGKKCFSYLANSVLGVVLI